MSTRPERGKETQMLTVTRLIVGNIGTNCYLVSDDATGSCVIIDPGDNAGGIRKKIQDMNVVPVAILLTHGHFDHILAVPGLKEAYPDIPIYAYEAEKVLLSNARVNESSLFGRALTLDGVTYLEDGAELDLLGVKWKLISTPGHTIGSCCYYIEEAGVLFSGDTLFDGDCGRTDLETGDTKAIIHSIREVLMKLPDDTQVLPGHETFTTIGRERKYNIVMRNNFYG